MPYILAWSGFRLLTKFSRQIFDVVGSKYGAFLQKKNSTTFNLRIGIFPQFVIFKFDRNIEVIKRAVKRDEMWGLPRIFSLFKDKLNKLNNTGAQMLGAIYLWP